MFATQRQLILAHCCCIQNGLCASEGDAKQRSDDAGLAEMHARQLETGWERHQRDRSELVKLQRELANVESNVLGVNAGRGMEAVHNEAERLNRELDEATKKLRSLYEQQNKNDTQISHLGMQIVEKQKKILEAEKQTESRRQDEKEKQRLEQSLAELSREIAQISEKTAEFEMVLPTVKAEEDDLVKRQREAETISEKKLDECRSNSRDLSRMRETIEK